MVRHLLVLLSVLGCALPETGLAGEGPGAPASDSVDSGTSESDRESAEAPGKLRFAFRDAAWPQALEWFADRAGLTLDLTDAPDGTFNYIDHRDHDVREALDVLNGYLLPRGYVLLRRDQFLVSLRTDNPILPNLIPAVPVSSLDRYGDNELLRTVVTVEGLELDKVAEQLGNVLGAHGKAAALDASNSLVLQGFGRGLRETVELLGSAVIPPADDELEFRAIPLKHIPAADAERQIQNLFGLASNPYQASMARRDAYYSRGRSDDRDREKSSGPPQLLKLMAMNMKVSALPYSNSLLVTATPAGIKLVEDVLSSIDVAPADGLSILTDTTPVLRVYTLDDADEDDVAETLDAIMPGVVINEDGHHDSVHVLATPAEHKRVEELIQIIDGGGTGGGVEVIRLTRSDPISMSDLLMSLFENEDRDDQPVITPDPTNTALVIRASAGQMAEIRSALAAFGERPGPAQTTASGSRFRRFYLQGNVDAERVARMVEELMQDDRQFRNPIRIVVPSDSATDRTSNSSTGDRVDLSQPAATDQPKRISIPISPSPGGDPIGEAAHSTEPVDRDRSTPASRSMFRPVSQKSSAEAEALPRVTIEVRDGELFLYSNDDVALDEIENTIRELVRRMPSRKEWTVFYLRAAAAEDTALSLVELIRDDTYATAAIGIGPDPYLAGVPTMRIIPDARTNALFVSGPASQVEMAGRFLKLLDTTELPVSLRDRVPRPIRVEYADVNAVADMIRELYKDFMEDPAERRRQQSRRNDDDRDREENREPAVTAATSQTPGLRPPGIRMTMAVDVETRTLLVSSNEQLYEQIRELVQQRDQAVLDTRPTVNLIRVNRDEVPYLQQILGSLPRVRVTASGATSGVSRPASANRSGNPSSELRTPERRDRD